MTAYAVRLAVRYDGLVIATFPDFPEIRAIGRDDEEACEEARRALLEKLEEYEREDRVPPEPAAQGQIILEPVARPVPA